MEKEQFDPHNYKSHEELPEDKKGEFKKVEGGFVRKETVDYERYLKGWAENLNKQRNILSKIFRENKKSLIDVAHEDAFDQERGRKLDKARMERKEKRLEFVESILKSENATTDIINDKGFLEEIFRASDPDLEYGHGTIKIVSNENYANLLSINRYEQKDFGDNEGFSEIKIIGLSKKGIIGIEKENDVRNTQNSLLDMEFDNEGGVGVIIDKHTAINHGDWWDDYEDRVYIPNPQKMNLDRITDQTTKEDVGKQIKELEVVKNNKRVILLKKEIENNQKTLEKIECEIVKREGNKNFLVAKKFFEAGYRLKNWGISLIDTTNEISLSKDNKEIGYWADGSSRDTDSAFNILGLEITDDNNKILEYLSDLTEEKE